MIRATKSPPAIKKIRCAIYTRKSTEEGLEQEFNSLDAQRESALAYVASQRHEGWECLEERYDDGGYTGGNLERPAMRRLLADIEAGRIDVVLVYKVDRLSRSLLDFARLMEVFDRRQVSFVSVTQQFNTANSMGRLVLNVLLSFAQFEREIISERTRDKIAAARRKGRWSGGAPLLGYDVVNGRLVVNTAEAEQVRAIFSMYFQHQGLLPVVRELERRGWRHKRWITRAGRERGGKPFSRPSVHQLLTNVAYLGQVRYKQEIHAGLHEAIIDPALWEQVQACLRRPRVKTRPAGGEPALLQGLLRCAACDCAMTPTYSRRKGKQYRYYLCSRAQRHGRGECPAPSLAAGAIEAFVIERLREEARNTDRLAMFHEAWDLIPPHERRAALAGLVAQIAYDGRDSSLAITLHSQEDPS